MLTAEGDPDRGPTSHKGSTSACLCSQGKPVSTMAPNPRRDLAPATMPSHSRDRPAVAVRLVPGLLSYDTDRR